jgi:hypothetical protein
MTQPPALSFSSGKTASQPQTSHHIKAISHCRTIDGASHAYAHAHAPSCCIALHRHIARLRSSYRQRARKATSRQALCTANTRGTGTSDSYFQSRNVPIMSRRILPPLKRSLSRCGFSFLAPPPDTKRSGPWIFWNSLANHICCNEPPRPHDRLKLLCLPTRPLPCPSPSPLLFCPGAHRAPPCLRTVGGTELLALGLVV